MKKIGSLGAVAALAATSSVASAAVVPSNQTSDTIIGSIVAGQSYTISISGFSTLCSSCNGGGPLTFDSNGVPTVTPVGPYAAFGPTGRNEDPSTPGIDYGIAGPGFNLGSLVFIYANPMGNAFGSSFSLQNGGTFTAGTNGTLRALVNDTNYSDNPSTGFTVTFAPTATGAVPEPATWAMMIGGFGAIGGTMRHRRRKMNVSFA